MRASKTQPPRAKPAPPAEKTKSSAQPPAETAFNPVWGRLALGIQPKLAVSAPDDPYEREADRVADSVMRMPEPVVQRKADGANGGGEVSSDFARGLGRGASLDQASREFFGSRFGRDFGDVRVHTGPEADAAARSIHARAFTLGQDIAFAAGAYQPESGEGRRLLAHELTHTIQQGGSRSHPAQVPMIQRQPADQADPQDPLTAPLTDSEWRGVYIWLSRGEVGIEPLTADADHNADLVASAIFCERLLYSGQPWGDPLLCVLPDVTRQDPRVQALRREVTARGPIIHWPAVSVENRLAYVMNLLVTTHGYPVNGAAGIVGNLYAESGVLPSRIEGSAAATPMRAEDFSGRTRDFNPDEVMNRSGSATPPVGPRMPGVGLAQWTTPARRSGLFSGDSSILFHMDRQVAYLVGELQAMPGLNASLTAPAVTVNDASDNVVYQFEIPGSILNGSGGKLPRADPAVQAVFATRRALAQRALAAHQAAQPAPAAAPAQP